MFCKYCGNKLEPKNGKCQICGHEMVSLEGYRKIGETNQPAIEPEVIKIADADNVEENVVEIEENDKKSSSDLYYKILNIIIIAVFVLECIIGYLLFERYDMLVNNNDSDKGTIVEENEEIIENLEESILQFLS